VSEAGALLHAILGTGISSEAEAVIHLEMALALEVDPLAYCANRFDLTAEEVSARAARWAGLAFNARVPPTEPGSPMIEQIERLGEIRAVRGRLFGREVFYTAPRFTEFIALRRALLRNPRLHRSLCVVPEAAIREALEEAAAELLVDEARQRLSRRWPHATGGLELSLPARLAFVTAVLALVVLAVLAPLVMEAAFVPLIGAVIAVPAALRLWSVIARAAPLPEPQPLDDSELPLYTVMLPLRDEANMVPQLSAAMRVMDYPPEKLQILFVVEQRSHETAAMCSNELWDPRFSLLRVPDAAPHTKPKALNYALPFVLGEHVVVYDAEDIPDPDQLRLAASILAASPNLHCLQAELVVDNASESNVTALFAGEYAGQFGLMLPLLARLGLPMPLGGTSNHFRVTALRSIGGWDPFNVTEDADLGVRLARMGYGCTTFDSWTREEAPIRLDAWLRQRTRWIKGWMQTFIVHNRRPGEFLADIGPKGFIAFQIYVGSMILSAPLHTAFVSSFGLSLLLPHDPFDVWDGISIFTFIVGYGGPVALALAGLSRIGHQHVIGKQAWLPVYWMLHSVAAARALWELLTRPYFWAKTTHGQTRQQRRVG